MKPIQIMLLIALFAAGARAQVTCKESDDHLVITRDDHHVLTYHKVAKVPAGVEAKYARSGFIHPISTPSGKVITDDYPRPHHSHQNGLFFAWRSARFEGQHVNFWEPGEAAVRHEKVLEILNTEAFAGFRVERAHVSGEKIVLREIWTVKVYADTGYIDLTSVQRCATESPLTLERFHYGGMAIRGSRQWFSDAHSSAGKGALKDEFVAPCRMITSEGLTEANGNHSRPKWVCMTGAIDAAPVSIIFVPHPANFRYPQHVRLHPVMPYFCFIPTVEKPFNIEPGKPWVSRYRIIAEDGEPDAEKLHAVQHAFAMEH
ncbi:MAG: hypothetical protein ACI9TH_005125 [Kiritimatiellia bacterium]|jgi:hypothetical protein